MSQRALRITRGVLAALVLSSIAPHVRAEPAERSRELPQMPAWNLDALPGRAPAPAAPTAAPSLAAGPRTSAAQAPEPRSLGRRVGIGLGGVVTAFLAHELGHISANLMLGNKPRFEGLLVWGFAPFFAVSPDIDCVGDHCTKRDGSAFSAGRRGKYFIVTNGFHVQHITDELILSLEPELRFREAPFRKGMLLFNVFLSCFYAAGAWTGLEDPHGDLGGAARLAGFDEVALSFALLAPAALDTYRYFRPSSVKWAPWVSRGAKAAFLGLNFVW